MDVEAQKSNTTKADDGTTAPSADSAAIENKTTTSETLKEQEQEKVPATKNVDSLKRTGDSSKASEETTDTVAETKPLSPETQIVPSSTKNDEKEDVEGTETHEPKSKEQHKTDSSHAELTTTASAKAQPPTTPKPEEMVIDETAETKKDSNTAEIEAEKTKNGNSAASIDAEEASGPVKTTSRTADQTPSQSETNVAMDIDEQETSIEGETKPTESELTKSDEPKSENTQPSVTAAENEPESKMMDCKPTEKPESANKDTRPTEKPESLDDVFEMVVLSKHRKKKRNKAIKLSFNVSSAAPDVTSKTIEEPLSSEALPPTTMTSAQRMLIPEEDSWGVELKDDSDHALDFFEETHEEQDPAYAAYMREKKKEKLKKQLEELEIRDREGRTEIENLIARLSKEKRDSTDKSHQLYREKVDQDEQKETAMLQAAFQERSKLEQQKIQKSLKMLQGKQQKEVNLALHHHQARRLPEQHAQMEWQKTTMALQAKHQRQLQEFHKRSEEFKRKTSTVFKGDLERLKKKYAKKRAEVDGRRDKFISQQLGQFSQLKHRYLRRHLQKIMTERESITEQMNDGKRGTDQTFSTMAPIQDHEAPAEKGEVRPPSPMTSVPAWAKEAGVELGGSILRQKNRKAVLSQAVRQLSIEIHNEGIWSLLGRKVDDDGRNDRIDEEFIPWGTRAFMTLESIVCGEIPWFYEKLVFDDVPSAQGGQLRCSITDLRTSHDTASTDRADAVKEYETSELSKLEKTTNDLLHAAAEAEKAFKVAEQEERRAASELEKAAKIHDRAKQDLENFANKFRGFLGPGKMKKCVQLSLYKQFLT